jgi:hypothetical protein
VTDRATRGQFVIYAGAWMELGTWKAGVSGPCWTQLWVVAAVRTFGKGKGFTADHIHDFCGFFFFFGFEETFICSLPVSFYFSFSYFIPSL